MKKHFFSSKKKKTHEWKKVDEKKVGEYDPLSGGGGLPGQ